MATNREEIIVEIDQDTAEVEVRVEGHAGPGCMEMTRDIEDALGERVAQEKTHEYRQAPARQGARAKAKQR